MCTLRVVLGARRATASAEPDTSRSAPRRRGARADAPASNMRGPLILLSPAKTLNFEAKLSPVLAAVAATQPPMLPQARVLTAELAKLGKPQIKSLMGLSDSLAALNHARFQGFDAQPARMAIGAFEGQAYKGLDAPSLAAEELDYLQGSLRILCGLYGVLRPRDEIRAYRLEMSTKLACAGHANLYSFWGGGLTEALNAELGAMEDSPAKFVLNVASQEYAKSVRLSELGAPVVTASFPGPAVYAKQARGEIVRFCAERRVRDPAELTAFCGAQGQWRYVPEASSEANLVFHRGAPAKAAAAPKGKAAAAGGKQPRDEAGEPSGRKRRK